MKKIAFVVVYGGKLPDYFELWRRSCEKNPTVDFFVFTDDPHAETIKNPPNVKVIPVSFSEIKIRAQKIFDFKIRMESAYKLCDYKPAYGEMFADYLKDYDFWGYCDMDLIWGDIRAFVTEKILMENERIFTRGHCSLFLNEPRVNSYYRTLPDNGHLNCKKVYQSDESWCFDEWAGHCGGGISVIFQEHGIKTYDEPVMADIKVGYGSFYVNRRPEWGKVKFLYDDGKLFACGKQGQEEILYCHFQKRRIHVPEGVLKETYMLVPPGYLMGTRKQNRSLYIRLKTGWLDCRYYLSCFKEKIAKYG